MAQRLRAETSVTLKWIAEALQMEPVPMWPTDYKTQRKENQQMINMNLVLCKYSGGEFFKPPRNEKERAQLEKASISIYEWLRSNAISEELCDAFSPTRTRRTTA